MHNKKRITPTTTAAIGALLTLIGGFFLFYNTIEAKQVVAYDYMSHLFYDGENIVKVEKVEQVIDEEDKKEVTNEEGLPAEVSNQYLGYLTIPKINLTKGFLDRRSSENDVNKNIMVIQGSNYPDVDKGNFIIAGHSGPGWNAFFKDLNKLQIGDVAQISYKGKTYIYHIRKIYKQEKTGTIAIYRNYDKTTLTLITCTIGDLSSQTVFVAELVEIQG